MTGANGLIDRPVGRCAHSEKKSFYADTFSL
jgi:hypothetical protein